MASSRGVGPWLATIATVSPVLMAVAIAGNNSLAARLSEKHREPGVIHGKGQLPAAVRDSVRGPGNPFPISIDLPTDPTPGIFPLGDQLVIHTDDDVRSVPTLEWEGVLSQVGSCVAGPSDFHAMRFPTQELSRELPIEVTGIELGLDNRYGRTTWPLVAWVREDPSRPLQPNLSAPLASVVGFSDPISTPAFPSAVAARPDRFMRFPVSFAAPVTIAADFAVDDGMWSDSFGRPIDETLDNPSSDWLECTLVACPGPNRLTVLSQRVRKVNTGDALGVKLAARSVHDRRPIEDLDLRLSVAYDLSAASAQRAGIFFRLESLSEFYYVEYVKSTNQVVLVAQTPSGPVTLGMGAAAGPTGTLRVMVTGGNPTLTVPRRGTMIEVRVNGSVVIPPVNDIVYGYTGVLSGLISLGASSGELWDDYQVSRNSDYFAVVQTPPGSTAALAAERSVGSAPFANVLASSDGVTFALLGDESGCSPSAFSTRPPNVFTGVMVRDGSNDMIDNLFQVEAKLTELSLACPTCPLSQNPCATNPAAAQATAPQFQVGETIDVGTGWWNERVPDLSNLWLRIQAYDVSCTALFALGATPIAQADVRPIVDPGQGSGGARFARLSSPGLSFVPTAAGEHCAMVIEFYDANSDSCPDGWEGVPCPPGCTCTTDPDQNATTGVITRDFEVARVCPGTSVSELDRESLRMVKASDPSLIVFRWQATAGLRAYNLHVTEIRPELQEPTIRDDVPVWRHVPTAVSVTAGLGSDCPGDIRYVAVFQTDGCPASRSLADP